MPAPLLDADVAALLAAVAAVPVAGFTATRSPARAAPAAAAATALPLALAAAALAVAPGAALVAAPLAEIFCAVLESWPV